MDNSEHTNKSLDMVYKALSAPVPNQAKKKVHVRISEFLEDLESWISDHSYIPSKDVIKLVDTVENLMRETLEVCTRCEDYFGDEWSTTEGVCLDCYNLESDAIYERGREEGW